MINKITLQPKIAIVGLGYVGLPLAVAFAKKYKVLGFDIDASRISALNSGTDHTLEVSKAELKQVLTNSCSSPVGLFCTSELDKISNCTIYIVTVPTPVDKNNHPDLQPLLKASATVGSILKKGDIVVYESTV